LKRLVCAEGTIGEKGPDMTGATYRGDEVAGGSIPPKCEIIEIRVPELKHIFNLMDPSPFHNRDLDPRAEEFIVGWAREVPRDAPLALSVHLDRTEGLREDAEMLRKAIQEFFSTRALVSRRKLRHRLRVGRTSLVIGLLFLAGCVGVGDMIAKAMNSLQLGEILRESLLIGGWVAMWRPLEIFLYDWWPIRAEARLYDRLSVMPVRLERASKTENDR
jgi:hypothetical protein